MMSSAVLDVPLPLVAYTVLHRSEGDLLGSEYEATVRDLHAKLAAETERLHAQAKKGLQELLAREGQMLLGTLSPYLETPIQSDRIEVQRALADALERVANQLVSRPRLGLLASSEAKVQFPSSRKFADRKMLQMGKDYLRELGMAGEDAGETYESVFLLDGSGNLDILEYFVRERLGVYLPPHVEHATAARPATVAMHNLIFRRGTEALVASVEGRTEIQLAFNKGRMKYDEFRHGIGAAVDDAFKGGGLDHISLWQRKLGLGTGREFLLRCIGAGEDSWEETLQRLLNTSESGQLPGAAPGVALIVKECQYRTLVRKNA